MCKVSKTLRLKVGGTYGRGVPVEVSQMRVHGIGCRKWDRLEGERSAAVAEFLVTLLGKCHGMEVDHAWV